MKMAPGLARLISLSSTWKRRSCSVRSNVSASPIETQVSVTTQSAPATAPAPPSVSPPAPSPAPAGPPTPTGPPPSQQSEVRRDYLRFIGIPGLIASFLIESGGEYALIETGPGSTLETLRTAIREAGVDESAIKKIFVTHIHLDHAGAAAAEGLPAHGLSVSIRRGGT